MNQRLNEERGRQETESGVRHDSLGLINRVDF